MCVHLLINAITWKFGTWGVVIVIFKTFGQHGTHGRNRIGAWPKTKSEWSLNYNISRRVGVIVWWKRYMGPNEMWKQERSKQKDLSFLISSTRCAIN